MKRMTIGVKNLLGDPKKAILKMSFPMMIGMLSQSLYNLVDGIWVAGLGADSLAAVGLFFPFFWIVMALGSGIGIGGSSAISRRIGEKNKKDASNIAIHTLLIGIMIALAISLPIFPFLSKIFSSMVRNKNVALMATNYAKILVGGAVILIFSNIGGAILRGEGDARRAMYAMLLGSGLNIILDPLFIYTFKMGIVGAAWATLTSIVVTSFLFIYWLFLKSDTYLDMRWRYFSPSKKIIKEILQVGIPSALAQLSMSLAMIGLNMIVIAAGGTDGIAILTSGWRIIMFGTIPLMGMAMGVVAVTGASFGAKNKEKLKTAYLYAVKIGVIIELAVAALIIVLAPQIARLFTYSKGATHLTLGLINFLRISAIMCPMIPLAMLTSAMFRGVNRGMSSFVVTILRIFIFQLPFAYILGIKLGFGLTGVWTGMVVANLFAGSISFLWGRRTVNKIL
ncbi:MAG: MATE family efflux transporter [Candidatus Aenigmarchaeota archaeon]|nr:MATE family efflux transporter [Candidatus Aenigmarchaeota archaeon]